MSLTDQSFRRFMFASIVALVLGSVLFVAAMAAPGMPTLLFSFGIIALVVGLVLRAIVIVDRYLRFARGLPRRHSSVFAPRRYTCPECGYLLRGVQGAYCPECGTVRPTPVDVEEDDAPAEPGDNGIARWDGST